jgi:tetratricopeptide (TPR) repeat protein
MATSAADKPRGDSGDDDNADITFVVPGQLQEIQAAAGTRAAGAPGTVKASVRVGALRGGGAGAAGDTVRVTARPGDDVVVLTISGGPTLVLHPQDARDLIRAQASGAGGAPGAPAKRSVARGAAGAAGAAGSAQGDIVIAAQLGWPTIGLDATRAATRGPIGQAILSGFEVVTNLFKDPADKLVAAAVTKHVDEQVTPGVYRLQADALEGLKASGAKPLANVPPADDGGPLLVLVHGTFVDTASTFKKLWDQHADAVRTLFGAYRDRVYALDHPTMGVSPIANALTLASALPNGARLHLVTHSRGGLVAEALARACSGKPLTAADEAFFAGDGYAQHLADLRKLVKLAQSKGLRVERVVRIACPARGTTLASKRFDAYLSVLKWGLELAGIPVAPQLVGFLHEVARRRADPAELPGIEAMMPESPFIQWLNNSADETIPGELRVIAGDLQGDSISSWVKTLLSDAFYWTDNDLVVQTRSMYGGAPRAPVAAAANGAGASFVLDRGGQVTHFNYFANERTVHALVEALTTDPPVDYAAIGPLSWAGEDSSGTRAAKAVARSRGADAKAAADRPAVFVLPGILGSNLKLDGQRIWLGFRFVNGLKRLAWDPATASHVEPDGPIGMVYDDLIDRLADTHEVIPFAFDWRRPIEDEAQRLAAAVDLALTARNASRQPVRIVAHSMGGLVARTMRLEKPDTWKRMMARDGARFLMLGTPNGGSWAPMQVMSGDDTFGNALVAFGALFDNGGARKMMAGMPGFLQLQASLLDPQLGLDKASTWAELAAKDIELLKSVSIWHSLEGPRRTIYEWGAPPQPVLDQAVALRRRLDAQIATLEADAGKMLLVVGHASFTPAGISFGDNGLEYLNTPDDGDGRVTLQSALLPGVNTWKVDAEHGKLPGEATAFAAYLELLASGDTALLPRHEAAAPGTRAAALAGAAGLAAAAPAAPVRSRPSRGISTFVPPSAEGDVFGLGHELPDGAGRRIKGAALRVRVLNGDLKFIRQPLLLGHYRALMLTGTEEAVDGLVGQAMSRSLATGLYPNAPGSHQIFDNRREDPDNVFDMARPSAAVVAGLGEEGKLRAVDLVYTVRQAVLAYAQRVAELSGGGDVEFEMAATLIGSGGTGVSAGTAAQLIAQGVLEANAKLQDSTWPQLSQLTFVELSLERAADAWRALQLLETAAPNRVRVLGKVQHGAGALRRSLDSSYRGAAYDFISALTVDLNAAPAQRCITYTLDTRRARAEVRAQRAQGSLLKELVLKASNDANRDPLIGRTLFNLLIPVEMEPFLGGTSEMLIELDAGTAVIPWELLDTNPDPQQATSSGDQRPWAIRSKLLRKLRVENFRDHVRDASTDDCVLVIGEPACDPKTYPPLPGARAEAIAVAKRLAQPDVGIAADRVKLLADGNDAQTVINALFERAYRVIHIAGHGAPRADGGVVLSGADTFLGANEVRAMRVVPELVFLNCCHLAGRDAQTLLTKPQDPYDRAAFAANIAEELIRVGVRCVIAAGWAVEDAPAEQFATSFYAALLGGARFIEAVATARNAAWKASPQGNTWAAYQCYGDPDWHWQREVGDAQRPVVSAGEQFAGIASPVTLTLALENIAIGARYSKPRPGTQSTAPLDRVRYLESEFAPLWGAMGAVAEAFGVAYAATGDADKAIEWYTKALGAQDASASFKAAEELGNQLVRRGEKNTADAKQAHADVTAGIAQLESLAALRPTIERGALLGSAYKRLTMIEEEAQRAAAATAALAQAIGHYTAAANEARREGASKFFFYPAKNAISCEMRAALLARRAPVIPPARFQEVRESLRETAAAEPDFWSSVGQIELRVLEAVCAGALAADAAAVAEKLRDLKARVPAPSMWDSVHTEARFTLEPYRALHKAGSPEHRAAGSLLAELKAMTGA